MIFAIGLVLFVCLFLYVHGFRRRAEAREQMEIEEERDLHRRICAAYRQLPSRRLPVGMD